MNLPPRSIARVDFRLLGRVGGCRAAGFGGCGSDGGLEGDVDEEVVDGRDGSGGRGGGVCTDNTAERG